MQNFIATMLAVSFFVATPALALTSPAGVAVDQQGNVYVADPGSQSVAIFNPQRQRVGTLSSGLSYPISVAITSVGRVFVADLSGNVVVGYDPGQASPVIAMSQYVSTPIHVRVGPFDEVWVENYGGSLHVYTSADGSFIVGQNSFGNVTGFTLAGPDAVLIGTGLGGNPAPGVLTENPADVLASRTAGIIHGSSLATAYGDVAWDSGTHVTWLADRTGHVDATTGILQGVTADPVTLASPPYGVAVDPIRSRLYVTEPGLGQVEIFSTRTRLRLGVLR